MKKLRINRHDLINILLVIFFITCVILPVVSMLSRISYDAFKELIISNQFNIALKNSLLTTTIATLISLISAFIAAWNIERTNIKLKWLFRSIFVLPMLIPSISHAFGLISIFGANGLLSKAFNTSFSIYGYPGIILGSVLYSFPIAFLLFSNVLKYENGIQYQAANVLGINRFYMFKDITLPFMKKTIITCFFSVFSMIITDYGVPLSIGGKTITISTLMYNKVVSMLDYQTGSSIGLLLLIPAILAFIVDICNSDNNSALYVNNAIENDDRFITKTMAYLFNIIVTIFLLLPVISFLLMSFSTKYPVDNTFTLNHVIKTIKKGADDYLLNSLIYSLFAGILGTIVSFISAYFTSRIKTKLSSFLHLLSLLTMAIPGIVFGLSYVIHFHDSFIYGTIIIVILANSLHFFSSPYLMMYNSLGKINRSLEDVGQTLGISRMRIIFDVIIPKTRTTIIEMFSYYFVNSMMTISAISFLAPPAPKAISLMINQFEAQLLLESAAFVSLVILICNILVKLILGFINKKLAD